MRRREAGVTLMELLVAFSLLSLLSVGMLFALRIGLNSMQKTTNHLMRNRRVMGAERVLEQQLGNFLPAKADCRPIGQGPMTTVVFFQGEEQTMRFVSSYSLQEANRGYPRILEYQVIPGESGIGVRLVVNELLYTGQVSTGQLCVNAVPDPQGLPTGQYRPVEVTPNSFVLADKLAYCRIFYKEEPQPPVPERWLTRWVRARPPAAIRIDMAPLDPDGSVLHMGSLTAKIRVNRDLFTRYTD